MKRIVSMALLMAALTGPAVAEESAAEALARGMDKETTERDPGSAISIYQEIVEKHRAEEEVAAKAQLRIGECREKMGQGDAARQAFEAVLRDFPAQGAVCERARERLAALGAIERAGQDPVRALDRKLSDTKIDVDFHETALSDVTAFLADFLGICIVIDPACDAAAREPQTLVAKKLAVDQVLRLAMTAWGLDFLNYRGAVVITTAARRQELQGWTAFREPANMAEEDRKLLEKLDRLKISLSFSSTPAAEVMDFIQSISDTSMAVDDDCGTAPVTLNANDTTLRTALELIALAGGLEYEVSGGGLAVRKAKR